MQLRRVLPFAILAAAFTGHAQQQAPAPVFLQPPGVTQALGELSSQPATHSAMTFDRDMIQTFVNTPALAALDSVTVENYRYHEPAFYIPEEMRALTSAYDAAGWHHLVNANVSARDAATPAKPITDMWLHFRGSDVDGCTVLIRAPKQMSVIEVSGIFRPLDFVHITGHFGIPKVDPDAVMVPAPKGR